MYMYLVHKQEVQSERESQRGSVVALIIAIVVVFVSINIEKVGTGSQAEVKLAVKLKHP